MLSTVHIILFVALGFILFSILLVLLSGKKQSSPQPAGNGKRAKDGGKQVDKPLSQEEPSATIHEIREDASHFIMEGTDDGHVEITIKDDYDFNYDDFEPPVEEVVSVKESDDVFNREYWEQWDREAFSEEQKEPFTNTLSQETSESKEHESRGKDAVTKNESLPEDKTTHPHPIFGVFGEDYHIVPMPEKIYLEY